MRNQQVYGRGASPLGHGHNYELEVTLRGRADPETGMVIDLKHLKDIMDAEVGARFDHRNLNDDTTFFSSKPATAENFCAVIFELLDRALPAGLLERVRLRPREDLWVEISR